MILKTTNTKMNSQEITDLPKTLSIDELNDLLDEIEDSPHEITEDLYQRMNEIYDILEICKINGYHLVIKRGQTLVDKY